MDLKKYSNQLYRYVIALLLMTFSILLVACDNDDRNQPSFEGISSSSLVLGVDRPALYGPLLSGKRVGLMVNQSSIDSQGRHTIEKLISLQSQYNFEVTTLFAVEHGLRGNEEAGFGDDDYIDPETGLQVWSLYGRDAQRNPRKRPIQAKLDQLDIVIFDLQDVGVRFFTYTISMHWMMESLQAYGKEFMVFDRPNPNGDSIYGPLLEAENVSGIGIHPIPMAHGLTAGEFAKMIVGEGWLKGVNNQDNDWSLFNRREYQFPVEKLHIIPMKNYTHSTYYVLPKRPSPNLATEMSVRLYPSLALFEATSVNMGRGSEYPHEQTGFPNPQFWVNIEYDVDIKQKDFGWPQAGKRVYGESYRQAVTGISPQERQATIRPFVEWWFKMATAGFITSVDYSEESNYLKNSDRAYVIRPAWLAKLVGNKTFLTLMQTATDQGFSVDKTIKMIEKSWESELSKYKKMREKYVLYQD